MPTPTYTLIQEQVLSSAASSVTFTSIPQTYKDLVLEIIGTYPGADVSMVATVNGDTAGNYSYTNVYGNGSTAASGRASSTPYFIVGQPANSSSEVSVDFIHFHSYSNTAVYKTIIGRSNRASSTVAARVSLWRSTAAITSLNCYNYGGTNVPAGSTFRLYGLVG